MDFHINNKEHLFRFVRRQAALITDISIEDIVNALETCRKERNTAHARSLQFFMLNNGLETHNQLGNCLVGTLAYVRDISDAQMVFNRLAFRDQSSWTSLIYGYLECGEPQKVLALYHRMQGESTVSASDYPFKTILKACTKLKNIEIGMQIHSDLEQQDLLDLNPFTGNALIEFYVKCGFLSEAEFVLDELVVRNVVSWTLIMTGYCEHGLSEKAIRCVEHMQLECIFPDVVTCVCCLKACGSIENSSKGQEVHVKIQNEGWSENNVVVANALIDMYIKCGMLDKAKRVFEDITFRDIVSWSTLMAGYIECGLGEEAMRCFIQMRLEGIFSDATAFTCSLKACSSIGDVNIIGKIHVEIESQNLLENNIIIRNTLVDLYGKFGLLDKARDVFDKLPFRDVVSWTSLIACYAKHEQGDEAIDCFELMQVEGLAPNEITFISSLKACGKIGASERGGEIHAEIERKGLLYRNIVIGTTLVDMYCKCSLHHKAEQVFDMLPVQDAVSWTALMAGYSQIGESEKVFKLYESMQTESLKPNPITFLVLLDSCNHSNLFNTSQHYFECMSKDYGITPTLEHQTCLVNILGHAGELSKAITMTTKMPFYPDQVMWTSLLNASQRLGNIRFGKCVFGKTMRFNNPK